MVKQKKKWFTQKKNSVGGTEKNMQEHTGNTEKDVENTEVKKHKVTRHRWDTWVNHRKTREKKRNWRQAMTKNTDNQLLDQLTARSLPLCPVRAQCSFAALWHPDSKGTCLLGLMRSLSVTFTWCRSESGSAMCIVQRSPVIDRTPAWLILNKPNDPEIEQAIYWPPTICLLWTGPIRQFASNHMLK